MATRNDPDKKELVVFKIRRDTECSQCGEELGSGRLITLVDRQPFCMRCAELDHLWWLPSGNTTLTRRTRKYSRTSPVVVRWSTARKRYERQGILAEREAIERAEGECLSEEEARHNRAERDRVNREEVDESCAAEFARRVRERYPGCPDSAARSIAEHACRRTGENTGTPAPRELLEGEPFDLAVKAAVRHDHTSYDELLFRLRDREDARREVAGRVRETLKEWSRLPAHNGGE